MVTRLPRNKKMPGRRYSFSAIISVVLILALGNWQSVYSAPEQLPVRLIAIMSINELGVPIGLPHDVHYDQVNEETYVISSGGQITVYDKRFFPIVSFGAGRGLKSPLGLTVDSEGKVYVCQGQVADKTGVYPRLSIFNAAFFLEKEVVFRDIPELVDFAPQKVAVATDGKIYLVGELGDYKGAVVLDQTGRFLRRLAPMDFSFLSVGNRLRKNGKAEEEGDDEKMSPVSLSDVSIDKNGRIYFLSREVGRGYVYNAKEEPLFQFGEKGGADRKLSNPMSVAVDEEHRVLYVCDYMRHTVLAYDYDSGRYVFEFGGRGASPLWYNFPTGVDVDVQGRVIVADFFNRRVQVVDPNMGERRPVASLMPPEIPKVAQPAGSEPVPEEPEIVVELPTPAAVPAASGDMAIPVIAAVPEIPAQLAGVSPVDVVAPVVAIQKAPAIPAVEIGPEKFKKEVAKPKRLAAGKAKKVLAKKEPVKVASAPPVGPVKLPEQIKAVPEMEAVASSPEAGKGRGFLSLPAALGVYGPVAALLGIGSWLLVRK